MQFMTASANAKALPSLPPTKGDFLSEPTPRKPQLGAQGFLRRGGQLLEGNPGAGPLRSTRISVASRRVKSIEKYSLG